MMRPVGKPEIIDQKKSIEDFFFIYFQLREKSIISKTHLNSLLFAEGWAHQQQGNEATTELRVEHFSKSLPTIRGLRDRFCTIG